jgi:capsid protein
MVKHHQRSLLLMRRAARQGGFDIDRFPGLTGHYQDLLAGLRSTPDHLFDSVYLRLQAQVPMQRGGGRLDERLNRQIETAWDRWCRPSTCHTAGRLSFVEISRLAIQAMAESGEVFIRMVPCEN